MSTNTLTIIVLLLIGSRLFLSCQLKILSIFTYGGMNFLLHFATDYVTSRQTFIVMGLDQFIHALCLIATNSYLA